VKEYFYELPSTKEKKMPLEKYDRSQQHKITSALLAGGVCFLLPAPAYAMHISEGILPAPWAILWFILSAPFVLWGLRQIKTRSQIQPHYKPFVALVGAAVFIISCLPIPIPVAGTCSHPVGTGLAAILIGPGPTVVLASVALAFQALFLAHGGLTTLGANIFSMGVAGAFIGYGIFWMARRLGANFLVAAFLAGLFADWATYAATALILTGALHQADEFMAMAKVILVAFVPTQVPLAVLEGVIAAVAYRFVIQRRPMLLPADFKVGGAA
jgi:cobalt/nickel transport system permease protein